LQEDYVELSASLGQRLMEKGGKELVEEAVKIFGAR
jgi:hypothetical protein